MKLALIGLGKMGFSMMKRLVWENHDLYVFDLDVKTLEKAREFNVHTFTNIISLLDKMRKKDEKIVVWVMVPSGPPTKAVMEILYEQLKAGDIVIDGGNSYYKDTIREKEVFEKKDIKLLDCGTSGGVWGLKKGYCLMVGGDKQSFFEVEEVFKSLSQNKGYVYTGPSGSGHFVKMIHNGIEYAIMGAFGEGFELLKNKKDFNLNLNSISKVWQQGSVIDSWLLDLCSSLFEKEGNNLEKIKGYVEDSGEGRWTVIEGVEERVSIPLISLALMNRFRSRKEETFQDKVIAGLRREFGGHDLMKKEDE